ncbi:MAG TPA: efflux RND transporter periplasmic adaptor subunit [Pirellulales bacterium]|jgi:HlyD family secretion protein|nr:efflux RND transporter periplasmic adaptor subunit [Pirellulales bacterium]
MFLRPTGFKTSVKALLVATVAAFLSTPANADEPAGEHPKPPVFQTAKVTRGDLVVAVRATGTIEPEEVVDVGAQVAGLITDFGRDLDHPDKSIDYNSRVEPGTLLAHMDPTLYQTQRDSARAGLERAEASVLFAQAKSEQTESELDRAKSGRLKKTVSEADYSAAIANQKMAEASLAIAKADVDQAKAALRQAQINLSSTVIVSPVKGTVIDRRVNIGQTVVAALNAPSLFLIARDLKRLEIWASVNEDDIAKIHPEQAARFTVGAFHDKMFDGRVRQVRLNAQMTQNQVTYTVVLTVDGTDEKLLPYMTANLQFEVARRDNVLLVPNAALRWRPRPEWVVPGAEEKVGGEASASKSRDDQLKTPPRRRVWVRDGKFVRPVELQIGISDDATTEITGGDLKEGQEVVVHATPAAQAK